MITWAMVNQFWVTTSIRSAKPLITADLSEDRGKLKKPLQSQLEAGHCNYKIAA